MTAVRRRASLPALALLLAPALAGEPLPAREVEVPAGRHGTFPAYLPAGADAARPCPLVVAIHGHGDTAPNFLACLRGAADAGGFALLVPEGIEKAKGGYGWDNFPDLPQTILAATKALLKDHPEVDPRRIVWLGRSTGTVLCCTHAPALPEICHGIVLCAAYTTTLSWPSRSPRPRVAFFRGTEDKDALDYASARDALRSAKLVFSANRVTGLGHVLAGAEYLAHAVHWVLASEGASEENLLPLEPPRDRACRHLLIRFMGAEGAPPGTKRSEDAARKEAEKLAEILRREQPGKRTERSEKAGADGGLLTAEGQGAFGPLLRWTCWTVPKGDVRVVRSPAGFHLVWSE